MGIFNSDGTQDYFATVHLNAPLDPERRMRYFETPLVEAFEGDFPGSRIEEGRTLLDSASQPLSADLEAVLRFDPENLEAELDRVTALLNRLGAPTGSSLRLGKVDDEEAEERAIGVAEGLVVVVPDPSPGVVDEADRTTLETFGDELRAALASDEHVLGVQEVAGESRVHVYSPDVSALADRLGTVVDTSSIQGITLLPIVAQDDDPGEWMSLDSAPEQP